MTAFIKKYFNYFVIGTLAIIPVVIAAEVVLFLKNVIRDLFFNVHGYVESYWVTAAIFALAISILVYIGYSIVRYRRSLIISAFDLFIERIPLLNTIYGVSKKVLALFHNDGGQAKKDVVYVEYPTHGIWVPAYVTHREGSKFVLFIPTSPNPTSGFTVIVDESRVVRSQLNIEEVSRFIMSIGVDFPKSEEIRGLPLQRVDRGTMEVASQ